ncbi:MAG: metallophosphoesterase [Flavobacteriales bacterium]|nr:metallophosphoesterase [Flavobacteriales bacterium]
MYRLIALALVIILLEVYTFQAFKTILKDKWILYSYQVISIGLILYIAYNILQFDRSQGQTQQSLSTIGLILILVIPKLVITLFLFGEDIYRSLVAGIRFFTSSPKPDEFLPDRRRFISLIALGLAAIPFSSLIYGIFRGKYNFKVIKNEIPYDDLPEAFDGLTITHISDIHSGSFDNPEKIKYAIDLINEQNSDLILFTGDIVNTHAREMYPWIDTFKQIKTPQFGKYSILGNHDYGEYVTWNSAKEKMENFENIKNLHKKIDFKLLLNESVEIKKGQDSIQLVGVENWGHNFKKAGDLNKAAEKVKAEDFKILMSHDPSHWEHEVKTHPKNFQLTLSGHTHGMQFGIEIPNFFKWSPVQYVYKQWAGLYQEFNRYIYVNRGFGFHAYPGRVGIWPEITVIKLTKNRI